MSVVATINGRSHAPWTSDEVESLNAYQASGVMHPFTGRRLPSGEETVLIAARRGWLEKQEGPVVQTWAHTSMTDWSWKKTAPITNANQRTLP